MKFIYTSIVLFSCATGSLANPLRGHKSGGNDPVGTSSSANQGANAAESLAQAAANWAKDTAVVSNFLNLAPTLKGQDFVQQAQIALDAELDELTHKAVLDSNAQLVSGAAVKAANDSLVTQGHFQDVVDLLKDMVATGDAVGVKDADTINANRCVNVLPSIDAYLAAAGTNFKATRPFNCDSSKAVATGAPSSFNNGGASNSGSVSGSGSNNSSDVNGTANSGSSSNTIDSTSSTKSTSSSAPLDASAATGTVDSSVGNAGDGTDSTAPAGSASHTSGKGTKSGGSRGFK